MERTYETEVISMLETKRLILRPWEEEDAADLYEYAKDPRVGPAAGWNPHKNEEESREIIRTVFCAPETYAVVLKETGKPVGSVGLKNLASDVPEVGYWVGVPYWGQGLIPEAVAGLIERCFTELGKTGVWCCYYDGNHKSRRVQEKCGFTYHHTERDKLCELTGDIHDEHYTYLSREDWMKSRSAAD